MKKKESLTSKLSLQLKIIVFLIIIALIFGLVVCLRFDVKSSELVITNDFIFQTRTKRFFTCFFLNFWLIFLIWIFSYNRMLLMLDFLMVFIKCFMIGITIGIVIKTGLVGICIKYLLIDILLYVPFLGLLLYLMTINEKKGNEIILIIGLIGCIIYSCLYVVIN